MPGFQRALLAQGVTCCGLNKLAGPAEDAALLNSDTHRQQKSQKNKTQEKLSDAEHQRPRKIREMLNCACVTCTTDPIACCLLAQRTPRAPGRQGHLLAPQATASRALPHMAANPRTPAREVCINKLSSLETHCKQNANGKKALVLQGLP